MEKVKGRKKRRTAIYAVVISSVILLILILCIFRRPVRPEPQDFSAGLSRIHALEAGNPNEVDEKIKAFQHQEMIDEQDSRLKQVDSGEISVWSLFHDYLIVGDSRAANFTMIPELDPGRNLGAYGNTILGLETDYDTIAEVNPAYLIVIVGLNDLHHEWIQSTDDFSSYMTAAIEEMQRRFPETRIYVNPIFPVIEPGLSRYSAWNDTVEYDAALRDVADSTGICYVNCDNIPLQDSYYRDDGEHFTVEFMTMWAKNIIRTIYASELGQYTSADQPADFSASVPAVPSADALSAPSAALLSNNDDLKTIRRSSCQ